MEIKLIYACKFWNVEKQVDVSGRSRLRRVCIDAMNFQQHSKRVSAHVASGYRETTRLLLLSAINSISE